jgi:hypothetical protein
LEAIAREREGRERELCVFWIEKAKEGMAGRGRGRERELGREERFIYRVRNRSSRNFCN